MVNSLLRPEDQELVNDERRALDALRDVLVRLEAAPDNLEALRRSIQQLDELFLVVIVGEFNAGKSAFINALLGAPVLKEGVTPTTAQVNLLQFGETATRVERSAHLHVITAPVEFLREIAIVDTPGTNAVIREHEAITADFVPRSDLVLFVTSADRPFTESERQFLGVIREWGKKIVLVINKVDLLDTEADLQQILTFVAEHARERDRQRPRHLPGERAPGDARQAGPARRCGRPAASRRSSTTSTSGSISASACD